MPQAEPPPKRTVEAVVLAASRPIEGCDTGQGGCGGMHTDCYYAALLQAACNPSLGRDRLVTIGEVDDVLRSLSPRREGGRDQSGHLVFRPSGAAHAADFILTRFTEKGSR